jgi:hypothetical protein
MIAKNHLAGETGVGKNKSPTPARMFHMRTFGPQMEQHGTVFAARHTTRMGKQIWKDDDFLTIAYYSFPNKNLIS